MKIKRYFLETHTKYISLPIDKVAIFTADMSGVDKTELAIFLKEEDASLLHIDTDQIREFFRPIGYDGQNVSLYQKVVSRGFSELVSYSKYSLFIKEVLQN